MAGAQHAKKAKLFLSTQASTASTSAKTLWTDDISFPVEVDTADVTVHGSTWRTHKPGLRSGNISFSGPASSTVDDRLSAILGSTGIQFRYFPESTASGSIMKKGKCIVTSYELGTPIGDRWAYSAEAVLDGAVTSTNA